MRFLILAHIGDDTAVRVCALLQARHGRDAVRLVSAEELVLAPHWSHRIEDLQVRSIVRLADGTVLDSDEIGVVFNRLTAVPMPHFASATTSNRDYAVSEMSALCLSWLFSLPCPVINPVSPIGLGALRRSHGEWLLLAARSGLAVQSWHTTTDPRWKRERDHVPFRWIPHWENIPGERLERLEPRTVGRIPTLSIEPLASPAESILVAGPNAVGRLAGEYGSRGAELARLAGCELLEIWFARSVTDASELVGDDWKVWRVDPFPALHSAEAITAAADLLESKLMIHHQSALCQP